jgi:8-oxo-dGTP pyrophosphatase MutT (NUDIX family)
MSKNRSRLKHTVDPDWKPDFSELNDRYKAQTKATRAEPESRPIVFQTLSNQNIYQGVLSIIELESGLSSIEPRFIVILDLDKELYRFPFGRLEENDISPAGGAERETKEEIGIELTFSKENNVGSIDFDKCIFHIFTKKVPLTTRVVLGEEQETWGPLTAEEIDDLVTKEKMAWRHAKSWQYFRQSRLYTPHSTK